jgi:hypothetical protein
MLASAALLAACTPTTPLRDGPPQPSVTATAALAEPFGVSGGKAFDRVTLRRFQLSLEVPDPNGWHPVRAKSQFLELAHAATGSHLVVRGWFENENATRHLCEERARRARTLPDGELIARAAAAIPEGFASEVTMGAGNGTDGTTRRYLNVFGARARHCFALSFTTEDAGAHAVAAVEGRVAVIRDHTLASVRLLSEVDVDPREPLPFDPLAPP